MGLSGWAKVTRKCEPGLRVSVNTEAAAASLPPPAALRGTPPDSRRTPRTTPASRASIEEPLNLGKARIADAARDVVRFGRRAVTRRRLGFLERHRPPGFGNAFD